MAQSYAFDVEGQVRGRGTGCLRSETRHADTASIHPPGEAPPPVLYAPPIPLGVGEHESGRLGLLPRKHAPFAEGVLKQTYLKLTEGQGGTLSKQI